VAKVRVVAQPLGALVTYASSNKQRTVKPRERQLVITCGARTFDWIVAEGLSVWPRRSGSVNRGMLDAQIAIAELIENDLGIRFSDYERIDHALRGDRIIRVSGLEYDISPHVPAAQTIARDAVTALRWRVGSEADIGPIIIAGGGADFFSAALRSAFPHNPWRCLEDGMFANVRGFQLAGETLLDDAAQLKPAEAEAC
jgi:plasmid segregation protein ParM